MFTISYRAELADKKTYETGRFLLGYLPFVIVPCSYKALASNLLLNHLIDFPFGIPVRFAQKHGLILVTGGLLAPDGIHTGLFNTCSRNEVPM
jgi:hypothetical protein